jgi:hypothetical protein
MLGKSERLSYPDKTLATKWQRALTITISNVGNAKRYSIWKLVRVTWTGWHHQASRWMITKSSCTEAAATARVGCRSQLLCKLMDTMPVYCLGDEMKSIKFFKNAVACLFLVVSPVSTKFVFAHGDAHVHGLIRMDLAIDAKTLTVQIEAPLDSLLGFEHRPRTSAQKQAAETMLKQMNNVNALIQPAKAAACKSTRVNVQSTVLQSPKPAGSKEAEHADLEASFEFLCEHPEKLTVIELGFFDEFKRVQKIEVQVAGAKGQSKQTLRRPNKVLRLN